MNLFPNFHNKACMAKLVLAIFTHTCPSHPPLGYFKTNIRNFKNPSINLTFFLNS